MKLSTGVMFSLRTIISIVTLSKYKHISTHVNIKSTLCPLDRFTFWQKCEFSTVQLVYSAYHISKHGENN